MSSEALESVSYFTCRRSEVKVGKSQDVPSAEVGGLKLTERKPDLNESFQSLTPFFIHSVCLEELVEQKTHLKTFLRSCSTDGLCQ